MWKNTIQKTRGYKKKKRSKMIDNLTFKEISFRGMYTLGVNNPDKLYFTSDT